jgi:hypothetical protein
VENVNKKPKSKLHNGVQALPAYKIRTALTYIFSDACKEKANSQSMAIPNEAMSIQEILYRHSQGIANFSKSEPVWGSDNPDFDDTDIEKMSRQDIHEQTEFVNTANEALKSLSESEKEQSEETEQSEDDQEGQRTTKESENSTISDDEK